LDYATHDFAQDKGQLRLILICVLFRSHDLLLAYCYIAIINTPRHISRSISGGQTGITFAAIEKSVNIQFPVLGTRQALAFSRGSHATILLWMRAPDTDVASGIKTAQIACRAFSHQ
jgi:hypothetical protein